jgi:AraC-like DNA-binding protein
MMVTRPPHPALAPLVHRGYVGYEESTGAPLVRVETPYPAIVVIVNLGPPLRVDGGRFGSFVAGLTDAPVRTEHPGEQAGIQLDLTPQGARMLLGVPMREVARQVVELDGLVPSAVVERLRSLEGWEARFAALDTFLLRRLRGAAAPRPDVSFAWARLVQSGGTVGVAQLCAELGCSRRHLAARFGDDVGLGPKAVARILRFQRALALLDGGAAPLAAVAAAGGFSDQPHFNREFRAMAGCTPGEYLATARAAAFPNVQDGPAPAA